MVHTLMLYHGMWFIWYAYDQVFSRMPCGTYQFFLVPVLDPSGTFCRVRDFLTPLVGSLILPLPLVIPFTCFLLASEIKDAIIHSAIYQILFPHAMQAEISQTETSASEASPQQRRLIPRLLLSTGGKLKGLHRYVRIGQGIPPHARRGIYYTLPIDGERRK